MLWWHYEPDTDLAALAAAYGWALATSHPFRDGNKRVAFLTMAVFVELNGYRLEVSDEQVVRLMVALAAGKCAANQLAIWLRGRLVRKK